MENWQDEIIKAQISQEIGVERSMENSDISVFLKSFKENLIGAVDRDSFDKSWSSDLQSKFPSGSWKTLNGARVFVNNGKVVAGLDGFNGEIDKFFDGKGKKESKKPVNERSQKEIHEEKQKIANSMPKPINKMTWEEFKPYGVEMQKQSAHSQPDSYYERMAKMEHDWAIKNDKSQYEVNDKQKKSSTNKPEGDGKSKPKTINDGVSVNADVKDKMEVIKDFKSKADNLKKSELYGGKGRGKYDVNPETVQKIIDLSNNIDSKMLSSKSKDNLNKVLEELDMVNADIWSKGNRLIARNYDFTEKLEEAKTIGGKLNVINDQLKLEQEGEDYDQEEHGALSLYEDGIEMAKNFIDEVSDEYINKNTTEVLNYKLF